MFFEVLFCGAIAVQNLSKVQEAVVIGKTSRGIYLKTEGRWLVFISFEPYRSPLTINLCLKDQTADRGFANVSAGQAARISPGRLTIHDAEIEISTANCHVWEPGVLPMPALPKHERYHRLAAVANRMLLRKVGAGLSGLLPSLLGLPATPPDCEFDHAFRPEVLLRLQKSFQAGDLQDTLVLLVDLLGVGAGLTPSGDDFVSGILLSLNRWKDVLMPDGNLSSLNERIIPSAYQKTNTLSANLIECATLGMADERLMTAIDYLMCGIPQAVECLDPFMDWGHSSGVDVFAGMVTVLSALPPS